MSREQTPIMPEILNLDMVRGLSKGKIRMFTIPTDDFPFYEVAAEAAELNLELISDEPGDLFINADYITDKDEIIVRLDSVKQGTTVCSIETPKIDDYELFMQTLSLLRQAQRRI